MKKTTTAVVAALAAIALGSSSLATMDIQKEYKAKDPKANCANCHVQKMPKKESAELNDFGKTVKAAKGKDGKIDWSKVKVPRPEASRFSAAAASRRVAARAPGFIRGRFR